MLTRYRIAGLALACFIAACASPSRLVYSSGFSFANYDYVFIAKPEAQGKVTTLYGMDVEFGNLMDSYNMKVVGDKEFETLSPENRARTLFARMAVAASSERIIFSVSFDDAVTGRTGATITSSSKGNLFEADDRSEAFETVSNAVVRAMQHDKGLQITSDKAP